jgi:hypothetical protein
MGSKERTKEYLDFFGASCGLVGIFLTSLAVLLLSGCTLSNDQFQFKSICTNSTIANNVTFGLSLGGALIGSVGGGLTTVGTILACCIARKKKEEKIRLKSNTFLQGFGVIVAKKINSETKLK